MEKNWILNILPGKRPWTLNIFTAHYLNRSKRDKHLWLHIYKSTNMNKWIYIYIYIYILTARIRLNMMLSGWSTAGNWPCHRNNNSFYRLHQQQQLSGPQYYQDHRRAGYNFKPVVAMQMQQTRIRPSFLFFFNPDQSLHTNRIRPFT